MPMQDFAGKTAVVTGAASGMGLAFAQRFADQGMNVVLADIESDALQTQVRRLEQQERNVLAAVVDTRHRDALEAVRDRAIQQFGPIHILCNNAGVTSREDAGLGVGNGQRAVWDVPDSTWEWVLGVNFWGVLHGLQVFVPHMLEHGQPGHIVNTASLAALIPGASAYSVSKHAVLTLTEGLYFHLKSLDSQIGASVLCPGFVDTQIALAERNRPAEFGPALIESTPEQEAAMQTMLGGGMPPADVADLVLQAVRDDRAYILPSTGWDDIVLNRVQAILDRQAPLTIDFEAMLNRRTQGQLI